MRTEDKNVQDKLDLIFHYQDKFDREVIKTRGLEGISSEEWIQKQTLAMVSELAELLQEVNFKWWKNKQPVNKEHIKEELIDILHFFVGMCLRMDMNAQEVYDIYMKKNEENFKRQYGTSEKQGYALPTPTKHESEYGEEHKK